MKLSHVIRQHAELPAFVAELTDVNGDSVDLTTAISVTFNMRLIGDNSVSVGGGCTILEPTAGLVQYDFDASDTLISGGYLGTITASLPAGDRVFPYNEYYLISVEADLLEDDDDPIIELHFATPADARSAGYQCTAEELLRAEGVIEATSGRLWDQLSFVTLPPSDVAILKKATIYQAVWMASNQDAEQRIDATEIRTAGLNGESAKLTVDGLILAPLARRLLVHLSWVRSRSVKFRRSNSGIAINPNSLDGSFVPWKFM